MSRSLLWLFIWLPLVLSGCASSVWTSYDQSLTPVLRQVEQGSASAAVAALPGPWRGGDLLYDLERGELLRTARDFDKSTAAWLEADRQFREFEEAAGTPAQWLDSSMRIVANDKAAAYTGRDYERVLLSSRLAMNQVAQGQWDAARIEIRKSHEMESRIAERNRLRQQKLEEEASKSGRSLPSWADIGGYPVEIVDAPAVRALKNGYQSAFSHYLAGFVYEALGENSLAAAGYRTALELQGRLPVLEDALAELDRRRYLNDGQVDTLIVVETGWSPARKPQNFAISAPYLYLAGYASPRIVAISFPLLQFDVVREPDGWTLGGAAVEFDLVTDTSLMARRALRDEMPGTIVRTVVRAVSRQVVSTALESQQKGEHAAALALANVLFQVGGALIEQADDRSWRTLPDRFYLARLRLPVGRQQLVAPGLPPVELEIRPGARQQLVVLRWLGQRLIQIQ